MPFQIVRNDITKMQADAIVTTANPQPIYADGTDRAVYEAAGAQRLLAERERIGKLAVGQAEATSACGLKARYLIHTVGPLWQGGGQGERNLLESCYENSLSLALAKGCGSIAFPLISTGNYGFPKDEALSIALKAIRNFLMRQDMMVYLVVFDEESFHLSGKLFSNVKVFIDSHYVQKKISQEYLCESSPQRLEGMDSERLGAAKPRGNAPCVPSASRMPKPPAMLRRLAQPSCPARERSLAEVMEEVGENFQERLLRLIDERGMTNAQVYKKANLDRKLFSKILCSAEYHPRKQTVLALAIALELSLDETKDLLARAEYALSPGSKFDLVVEFFITQGVYDVFAINAALFDYGQPMLGGV